MDNGAIRFTHVRVPRINLLDRFGSVDKSGRCARGAAAQLRAALVRCVPCGALLGAVPAHCWVQDSGLVWTSCSPDG